MEVQLVDLAEADSIGRDIVGTLMEEGVPKPLARAALASAYARLDHKVIAEENHAGYIMALEQFTRAYFVEGAPN